MEFRFGIISGAFDTSLAFYRDALGFAVEKTWDRGRDDRGVVLAAGGGRIEILPTKPDESPAPPAGVWVYIQVADVDAAYARSLQFGVQVIQAPKDEPWGHRVLRLRDPNGMRVNLFAPN